MTKKDQLEIMMLLSALESWGFSTNNMFPDYLHERLVSVQNKLLTEVLDV